MYRAICVFALCPQPPLTPSKLIWKININIAALFHHYLYLGADKDYQYQHSLSSQPSVGLLVCLVVYTSASLSIRCYMPVCLYTSTFMHVYFSVRLLKFVLYSDDFDILLFQTSRMINSFPSSPICNSGSLGVGEGDDRQWIVSMLLSLNRFKSAIIIIHLVPNSPRALDIRPLPNGKKMVNWGHFQNCSLNTSRFKIKRVPRGPHIGFF